MILTPDANKITVFNKGTWKGLKQKIPVGGHIDPNSTLGLNLEWKKDQKKERKKKISLTINKIIPTINPDKTRLLWYPWNVPSRITSRHHTIVNVHIKIKDINTKSTSLHINIFTNPIIIFKALKPTNKGHGDTLTKWNGW